MPREVVKAYEIVLKTTPVMTDFNNYRLKRKLVDCRVRLGGVEFDAHRLVLENASEVFKQFFATYFNCIKVLDIEERFVSADIADEMMNFFYTNRIRLTLENAEKIAIAAKFFILPQLLKNVEEFISANLKYDNVLNYFKLSDRCSLEFLNKNCVNFLALNHRVLFSNDNFLRELTAESFAVLINELRSIFVQDNLKKKLFSHVVSWVEFNIPVRSRFMPILLECLPLEEFPLSFLLQKVEPHPLVHNMASCNRILTDVLTNIASKNTNYVFEVPKLTASQLYTIGGTDEKDDVLSSISHYDTHIYEWKQSPSTMKNPREFFAAASEGTKIYIAGGHDSGFQRLASFEVYDTEKETIVELAPMPNARNFCAAATLNGLVYVSGGADNTDTRLNSMIRYDPATDKWESCADMKISRANHQMVKLNGYLYAMGGGTTAVEKYLPHKNEWKLVACMAITHSWFSATVHNSRIYVCGRDGFEEYNPSLDLWRILPRPKLGTGTTLVSIHNKLWAIGGCYDTKEPDTPTGKGVSSSSKNFDKFPATKEVLEFDLLKLKWRSLPNMDVARKFHSSVVVKKKP